MPEVSRDEMGRRAFAITKEHAVETAMEKIRKNPASEWQSLSEDDRDLLAFLLGEIWIIVPRSRWESMVFSRVRKADLRLLLAMAQETRNRGHLEELSVHEFSRILQNPS